MNNRSHGNSNKSLLAIYDVVHASRCISDQDIPIKRKTIVVVLSSDNVGVMTID